MNWNYFGKWRYCYIVSLYDSYLQTLRYRNITKNEHISKFDENWYSLELYSTALKTVGQTEFQNHFSDSGTDLRKT